ncbi:MAG: hypothetical protein ACR2FX_00020 [Chthoniobacterales bacterium]
MLLRFLAALSLVTASTILADEGMWLFNNPPFQQLKEKYPIRADTPVA